MDLPDSAFFLPPLGGTNKGVDFLGIRQVNLDMMSDLIPSTNNATPYIRPFTLLCWIHWQFYELCAAGGRESVDSTLLRSFRERIEVLFTWGARLDNYPRIPGKSAAPPISRGARVPLSFDAWGRIDSSTGLMAALWYGPALKTRTGLELLDPRGHGFFRATARGTALARVLDAKLRRDERRYARLLSTLDEVMASEQDAANLWRIWSPDRQIRREKEIFAGALFAPGGDAELSSPIARRSRSLALARLFLARSGRPCTEGEIREGMFFAAADGGKPFDIAENLALTHRKWVVLQMRQLHRLALESLLSWCEAQIIRGERDTTKLAQAALESWREHAPLEADAKDFETVLSAIGGRFANLRTFLDQCRKRPLWSPFELMDEILQARRSGDDALPAYCLLGLLICSAFTLRLVVRTPEANAGGFHRLSLRHTADRIAAIARMSLQEALRYILESLILSQHFATAVGRFDGESQRLRLTLEEEGLEPLVTKPLAPTVAEDRLAILLSLAADCGLVDPEEDGRYSWTEAAK